MLYLNKCQGHTGNSMVTLMRGNATNKGILIVCTLFWHFFFWETSQQPYYQDCLCLACVFVCVCVCCLVWSNHVQLVVTALKSSLIMHPLVWASQLLLCLSWQSSEVEDGRKAARLPVSHCHIVCVFSLTCPIADWMVGVELAAGCDSHVKA